MGHELPHLRHPHGLLRQLTLPQFSLAVVGADYPNKRGPTRRFEIALCPPGDRIELRLEPRNKADPLAVAVYSCRGVQIGYLTAERAPWIGKLIRQGRPVSAVFQEATHFGAVIRVAFDNAQPALPTARESGPEPDWWPDEEWPDD